MQPITLTYSQIIALRGSQPTDQPIIMQSRPGGPHHSRTANSNKVNTTTIKLINRDKQKQGEIQNVSNLLQSALFHIQRRDQELGAADQQILSKQMSSMGGWLSRDITPVNPLLGGNLRQTRKRKQSGAVRNKLHSVMSSELFEIRSQRNNQEEEQKQYFLEDRLLGQIEVVYQYIFGKPKRMNPKLYNAWKQCLEHQDKTQVYGQNAAYSHPRIFPINEVQKGFDDFCGTGKNRILYAGQEAIIIETISKYLDKCTLNPQKFGRKLSDIVREVLQQCKLTKLQDHPYCIKQIQTHFLLMATRWKHSGKLNMKDKVLESCLIIGKNNLLDLKKDNLLTKHLKRGQQSRI